MCNVRVRVMCTVKFRIKLWCGLNLGFKFRLSVGIKLGLGLRFHEGEGQRFVLLLGVALGVGEDMFTLRVTVQCLSWG